MKKILSVAILFLLSFPGTAQRLYVRTSLGYAIPSFNSDLTINGYPYSPANPNAGGGAATQVLQKSRASHGSGFTTSIEAGFWFNKHMSVNLGFTSILKPTVYAGEANFGFAGEQISISQRAKGTNFISITLGLRDEAFMKYAYVNAGVILPVTNKIVTESQSIEGAAYNISSRTVMTTNFGVGLLGSIGIDYPVSKTIAVSAGISLTALSLWAKESEIQSITRDGENIMQDIPKQNKRISYVKDYQPTTSPGNQTTLPSYQIPFSSFSFRVGLSFLFHQNS